MVDKMQPQQLNLQLKLNQIEDDILSLKHAVSILKDEIDEVVKTLEQSNIKINYKIQ